MKILHVIPSVSPLRGGPSASVLGMVKALNTLGHEAEILTTNDHGSGLLDVSLKSLIEWENVPVRFFSRFSPPIASIREYAWSSTLFTWLWYNIESYQVVHVHAIFSAPSTMAMLIARIKRVPYLIRPPGQLCEWALGNRGFKKKIYLDLLEKSNLNHSRAIHFASKKEQDEASSLSLTTPSFVLPHGINAPVLVPDCRSLLREQLGLPNDETIILFLGRLHPVKGLDYLIPALGSLSHYSFTFVLAGSGEANYESHLQKLILDHGLKQRTFSMGFITGKNKEILLQGSDIFAMTSHQENFGIAALEALSVGLTVVTTPGVALSSILQEKYMGYVCKLDIKAIAQTISECLDDPDASKSRGALASQVVRQEYTWDAHAKKLSEIYCDILSSDVNSLGELQQE
jgi:glycosyltransferase involved in cell wall biosynthesis